MGEFFKIHKTAESIKEKNRSWGNCGKTVKFYKMNIKLVRIEKISREVVGIFKIVENYVKMVLNLKKCREIC